MSSNLIQRDREVVWHPFASLQDENPILPIVSAKGSKLILEDGREILDMVSSWWVNIHGHGNERLAKVLYNQVLNTDHVIFAGFTHEPAVKISELLLTELGSNFSKVFFTDNGSTAIEVAIKMALQFWENNGKKRTKILALEGAYHGDTFGAMSLAGKSPFFKAFNDLFFDVISVPFPVEGEEQETIAFFEKQADENTALFIYEPLLQGAAGMRIYEVEVLNKLLEMAQKHQIVTIADEVLTGFGRTGTTFASQKMAIQPDLICLSKGITGGLMALGVTCVSNRVVEAFQNADPTKTLYHGHSYTGNPLSCALAVESWSMLNSSETQSSIEMIQLEHSRALSLFQEHKKIKTVKMIGTILAIEVKQDEVTSYFNSLRNQLYQAFLQKNILMRPLGNVIYVMPPYIITKEELTYVYSTITEILDQL